MSESVGALRVDLSASSAQFASDMGKARNAVQSNAKGMQTAMEKVKKSFDLTLPSITKLVGAFSAVYIARQLISMADTYTLLDNKLKLVTKTSDDLAYVQQGLYEQSLRSHSSYESSVNLYSRFAKATQTLGVSQDQLLQITETLNKAMIVSGATQEESKNAIIQLSQGMASGVLRGEEFNSIMENGSRIAKMLADYLKTDIGGLRKMAMEGKITSDIMVNAFTASAQTIEEEFSKMEPTISQAMTDLKTVFGKLVSDSNKGADGTKSVAIEIRKLAETIDQNREGIIELFIQIISLAAKAAKAIGNIGQSIQGWAAVKSGRLGFLEFAAMNAEDLNAWLKENNTQVKNLQHQIEQVSKKIADMTGPLANQFGLVSKDEIAKLMAERTKLEALLAKAQTAGGKAGSEFPPLKPVVLDPKAVEEARKRAEAIQKVIQELKFEHSQMLLNDREQAIANSLKKAGIDITSKYGQQIADLAGKNYDLAQETKAAKEESDAYVKAAGEWEKEKQALIDSIDKEIEGLQQEADTFGMTATQAALYKLALQGATQEQLRLAESILVTIEKQERIKKLTEEIITPQEIYNNRVAELKVMLDSFAITWDQYTLGMQKAKETLESATKEQKNELSELQKAIEGWGRQSADAIVDFALKGKGSFSDMAQSIIADIMKMIVYQQMMKPLFDSLSSGSSGSWLSGLFSGGKASGGSVGPGKMYEVNERGAPELLNVGNRQFLMMGDQGGYVAAAKAAGATDGGGYGGGDLKVTIIDNNNSKVSATKSQGAGGMTELKIMIDTLVGQKLGEFGSKSNKSVRQNFDTSQRLVNR